MAKWRLSEKAIKEQIEKAKERTRLADAEEPRAVSVYFDESADRVTVELSNGTDFRFSPSAIEELAGASSQEISQVEISPSGRTLRWKNLDADLSLPSMMVGIFGTKLWMAQLGRAGGQSTSAAKAAAARLNGMRGGRPALVPGQRIEHPTWGVKAAAKKDWTTKSVAASALSQSSKKSARAAAAGRFTKSERTARVSKKK